MVERGWSDSTQAAVRVFLIPGAACGCIIYSYLPNISTRIFISLYSSILYYVDDICSKQETELLKSFSKVLLMGTSFGHEVADALVDILREIPQHYDDLVGSLIVTSTLRFITSTVMEEEVPLSSVSITIQIKPSKYYYLHFI
jgi:hypothetical protein